MGFIRIDVPPVIVRRRERLALVERRQPALARFLIRLPIRLGLDRVQTHLFPRIPQLGRILSFIPVIPLLAVRNTTPPKRIKAAAEKEEYPRREREPDGVPDGGSAHGVDAGLGDEEEGEVEYECEEGDGGGEAGDAGAAAGHGHLADVREEAEYGGARGERERDDVQHQRVGQPFHHHRRDIDLAPHQTRYIYSLESKRDS